MPGKPSFASRKLWWVIGLMFIGLSGTAGTLFIISWINRPAIGVVTASDQRPFVAVTPPQPVPYKGTYVRFSHPGDVILQPQDLSQTGMLERHVWKSRGVSAGYLTLTVSRLPSGSLDDDASYTMRRLHPEKYQLRTESRYGERLVVATDNGESQQTAFWPHAGKLLIMSYDSSSLTPDIVAQFQAMLNSVVWL